MTQPWVNVCKGSPYFCLDDGASWTPIGQNDALEWPEFSALFRRRDPAPTREYFALLARSGVTVLRLMLEYCHHDHRYFERPVGRFQPAMVKLWDDIFELCREFNLRVLLTPFDTFWMWRRWNKHPYNAANGGPCTQRERFFLDEPTRACAKARLDFVTARWGHSGAIFAWDLWNELHPAYGLDSIENAAAYVTDITAHLRQTELRLFGRAHLTTVSTFLPLAQQRPRLQEVIYQHPGLDFATTHFYEEGTIDAPRNTVEPAISTGRLVREALAQAPVSRPFFDSEHGPIHTFKDHHRTLPAEFDDEYFRHMQWAHLASGGAGGGMRWPNRKPHSLTPGMREAQHSLAGFLSLVDWARFARRNWNEEIQILSPPHFVVFGCGDSGQAILWILRKGPVRRGILDRQAKPLPVEVQIPWQGASAEAISATAWDTTAGRLMDQPLQMRATNGLVVLTLPPILTDAAIILRR